VNWLTQLFCRHREQIHDGFGERTLRLAGYTALGEWFRCDRCGKRLWRVTLRSIWYGIGLDPGPDRDSPWDRTDR